MKDVNRICNVHWFYILAGFFLFVGFSGSVSEVKIVEQDIMLFLGLFAAFFAIIIGYLADIRSFAKETAKGIQEINVRAENHNRKKS